MILFLLLVAVAVALGLIGVLVKGLFYLLIIGIAVFVLDLYFGRRRIGRRHTRSKRHTRSRRHTKRSPR